MRYIKETNTSDVTSMSRRVFFKKSATIGAGFTLAMTLPGCVASGSNLNAVSGELTANAFVRISPDNAVTIIIKHIEFGQGTFTGLATIAAEEMDADWDQIVSEAAPANRKLYANLYWGIQGTGGSTAIANSYMQMREAGASARYMLVAAAAQRWGVPVDQIRVSKGIVSHESGVLASFGELAEAASNQSVPDKVRLKDPKDFTLIGRDNLPRKDLGKTDGTAIFTQDVKLPGMLIALVAHPPRFGAKVKSFSDKEAKAIKGVVNVVEIPNGVAVIADTFWSAKKGRDALVIDWDFRKAMTESSTQQMQRYREAGKDDGLTAHTQGDLDKAFKSAVNIVEADYEFPYLAHATMEPMNCVVQITDDGVEVWNGSQSPTGDQLGIAAALWMLPGNVKINTLFAGGSFGRRSNKNSDYVVETAHIAKEHGQSVPIKLVWTREDDTNAGYFRPMYFHKLRAGLDSNGKIIAWQHKIIGQSIMSDSVYGAFIKNGIDDSSVEGATSLPYSIPNFEVKLNTVESQVPVLWWRSVGSTHTAYSTEVFMDELAAAAGQDPLEFRRAHLGDDPRYKTVLDLAIEKSGWGSVEPDGRSRGVAIHKSFGSYVAQVAELVLDDKGGYKVDKVICAVDCGVAINPDVIRAQLEGGIGYGLSPALMSEITIDNGAVVESNFDTQKVVRMRDMPTVDVHIIASAEPPTGVGEPGTPVIAPAVANALFAQSGKTRHKLPLGPKV
jgi:isoquinoline 1-oxidoreductase beta subunit